MTKKYKLYRHILRKEISEYEFDKYYYGITSYKYVTTRWNRGDGYIHNNSFYKDILKFKWDNFEHEVLFNNLTLEEAESLERMYIALYDTMNPKHGYNKQTGGIKYDVHPDTRKKFSDSKKGKNNPMYGKPHSKEHNEKISKNSKNKIKVINLDTGEIFNSIKEASEKYNCNRETISAVCRGRGKTAGGYHWAYYD